MDEIEFKKVKTQFCTIFDMKKLILLALISCSFILSHAQECSKHLNRNKKQIAVDGYDLVSYIKDNKASTGNKKSILRL